MKLSGKAGERWIARRKRRPTKGWRPSQNLNLKTLPERQQAMRERLARKIEERRKERTRQRQRERYHQNLEASRAYQREYARRRRQRQREARAVSDLNIPANLPESSDLG